MRTKLFIALIIAFSSVSGEEPAKPWKVVPPPGAKYFPIGVWLQDPGNANRFKSAGINLYVGLWEGPTQEQLDTLGAAGMPVICEQTRVGLANLKNPIIVGWMHQDEPDNAQPLGGGKGYGPPISPEIIRRDYEKMHAADPSRPVMLNLGQGVAWDQYIGRGVRRNHPEDYPEYLRGCDIASFDIYPVVHEDPEIRGRLKYVARGVERLVKWGQTRPTWNCIECTHIGNAQLKATSAQVRTEVWMSLIHGSRGLIYFVHQFKPTFREAALLDDPEMLAAVTSINNQVQSLAPALNSPDVDDVLAVKDVPVASVVKRYHGQTYLFAVNERNEATHAEFRLNNVGVTAEVLGESRQIKITSGRFVDDFKPYEVHLYRIPEPERHE